jgi:protein phosphatase
MAATALQMASRSDSGRVRKVNEDAVGIDPAAQVVVLADGLARRHGADVASRLAVRSLLDHLRDPARCPPGPDSMRAAFANAEQAIGARAATDPQLAGMGATAIAVRFAENRLHVGHIGDARLYRLRRSRLERLTVDHSFLQTQLATGRVTEDEARASRSRHFVTRALGSGERSQPDVAEHLIEAGDIYVLCTDGLHELVDETELAETLCAVGANAELCAETLVTMANDRGGTDNVSVIVVRVVDHGAATDAARPGLFDRLRGIFNT